MHESPTVEILLGHGRFIRVLARELVRDAHAAEDLAQEAHARWLEHGAAGLARPRAWLRRVVRNLAANQAAAEQGRRAREQATARADSAPSAADGVAQAELLQAVGAAVLALEEPYRSTILARYYHGLDARQLAQESGTPLATVRSREQRALARLRERLDREHGGREGWALVLVELGGGAATAAIPLWFAWTCVAGSLALWVVAWQVRAGRSAVGAASATTAATEAASASSTPASTMGARVPAPPASSARVASAPQAPAALQASSADPSLAVVKGRLLLEDRTPASHTLVALQGRPYDEERVRRFGLPQDWRDPTIETGDDGSFTLSLAPPAAFQFLLLTTRPPLASARWRWSELRPGETKDLGEVVLFTAGAVAGRLVDGDGRALAGTSAGGWRVSGASVGLRDSAGRDDTYVSVEVAPDGTFRLEGLHPGLDAIRASASAARIDAVNVRVAPGALVPLELVYRGPDLERRVTVRIDANDVAPFRVPPAESLHLLGCERVARALDSAPSTYVFDDVAPGSYTLVIDDPRCRPWRQDGVQPGVPVRARPIGSAALALTVLAEDGLTPVPAFAVRLRALGNGAPTGEHLVHDGSAPLAGGVLTDVYPGDYSVTVVAGDRSARASVSDLGAGEVRALTLRFESHPSHVAGRVLRPSGEPVAHAYVRLIRPALVDDSDATPILPATGSATTTPERFRHELAVVESSADGGFQFDATEAGAYVLEASTTGARVLGARFVLAAGESRDGLELALGAPASLRGHALGPPGARFEGLSLALRRAGRASELDPSVVVRLKSDGSFSCANAPTGELEVWLALPQQDDGANPIQSLDAFGSGQTISNERFVTHVTLVAGAALEHELDIAAIFPATVVASVNTGGAPASGVYVTWLPHERGGPDAGTTRTVPADSNGATPPATLFPGAWDALVFSPREHWLCVHPVPVEVAPGARAELVVPVRRHPGTITCLDASGRPFADQEFNLTDAEERFYLAPELRTDASGGLQLSLAPGTYRLRKLQYGTSGPVAKLHWTESGPADALLRF